MAEVEEEDGEKEEKIQQGSQFDRCLNPLVMLRRRPDLLDLAPCSRWVGDLVWMRRERGGSGRTA